MSSEALYLINVIILGIAGVFSLIQALFLLHRKDKTLTEWIVFGTALAIFFRLLSLFLMRFIPFLHTYHTPPIFWYLAITGMLLLPLSLLGKNTWVRRIMIGVGAFGVLLATLSMHPNMIYGAVSVSSDGNPNVTIGPIYFYATSIAILYLLATIPLYALCKHQAHDSYGRFIYTLLMAAQSLTTLAVLTGHIVLVVLGMDQFILATNLVFVILIIATNTLIYTAGRAHLT